MLYRFYFLLSLFCLGLLLPQPALAAANPKTAEHSQGGAVATQHPLATQSAINILKKGGNAVDAAIAAAFTLAVVEPYNSGLGAGGLGLVWDPTKKKAVALDFREVAPLSATAKMYQKMGMPKDSSRNGPLAIAVPGEVAGLGALHQRWGKLPWDQLFTDAIRYAESGFEVDPALMARSKFRQTCLSRDYHSWKVYRPLLKPPSDLTLDDEGNPEAPIVPRPPPLWVQSDLAQTLKTLRDDGAKSFYAGPLAYSLISNLKGKGALLTLADLKNYQVKERTPIIGKFDWGKVWGFPLPSSGGISVVRGLNTLEAVVKKTDDPDSWLLYMAQIFGQLFADRNQHMGDPDFVPGQPVPKWVSKSYAKAQAKQLIKNSELPAVSPNPSAKTSGETSHLSVMDASGQAVALTLTQNLSFGSCVTAGATGILMNNQMDDFSTQPFMPNSFGLVQGEANRVEAGKRPLSSMSPTIVTENDTAVLAVGSPGGPRIITTVIQILYRRFVLRQNLTQALQAPRVHYQGQPKTVFVEPRLGSKQRKLLQSLKIPLKEESPWGNVQAVAYEPSTHRFSAFSDPRSIGQAQVLTPAP